MKSLFIFFIAVAFFVVIECKKGKLNWKNAIDFEDKTDYSSIAVTECCCYCDPYKGKIVCGCECPPPPVIECPPLPPIGCCCECYPPVTEDPFTGMDCGCPIIIVDPPPPYCCCDCDPQMNVDQDGNSCGCLAPSSPWFDF